MTAPRRPARSRPDGIPALPERPRFDFHSHTFLTDGTTAPTDMWVHADRLGHRVLAITDHVSLDDPAPLVRRLSAEARAFEEGPMIPLVGVEVDGRPGPHRLGGPGGPPRRRADRHRPRRDP